MLFSILVAVAVFRGVVILYQSVEVAFSLVDQVIEAVVEAVVVAERFIIDGATVSGVVLPAFQSSPFCAMPFGRV